MSFICITTLQVQAKTKATNATDELQITTEQRKLNSLADSTPTHSYNANWSTKNNHNNNKNSKSNNRINKVKGIKNACDRANGGQCSSKLETHTTVLINNLNYRIVK